MALCDALKANSTLKELKCDPDSNLCHVQMLAQKSSAATDNISTLFLPSFCAVSTTMESLAMGPSSSHRWC